MARNQEKANTMLARFLRNKLEDERPRAERPAIETDCTDINDAERFRGEIVREATNLISDIQNVGLEEHEIRELNDRINRQLRLKRRWEAQIVGLGGPDYSKVSAPIEASSLVGERGYKYFGVAKDLPGVKEYLAAQRARQPDKRPTRAELLRRVDVSYYGFQDEENAGLMGLAETAEKEMRAEAIVNFCYIW